MPFWEPLWKKLEREEALKAQYPEFGVAQSPDKVLQVDNYRLRNGGPVSEWSQTVMRLAKATAAFVEQEEKNRSGLPAELQPRADLEAAAFRAGTQIDVPGVPTGVAEAFPETTRGRKVYQSGSASPSLNIMGSFLDNQEGLPDPLKAALNTPILGQGLREATRPANWMSAAIAPLSFAPGASAATRFGAEIAAGTVGSIVGQEVTDRTGNSLAGFGAGLLAGQATGAGASRALGPAARGVGAGATAYRDITKNIPLFKSGSELDEILKPSLAPSLGGTAPINPSAISPPVGSALHSAAQSAISSKSTIPAGIARSLDQARSMAQADKPGLFAKAFYRVPGTQGLLRPGIGIPDNLVEAYAARQSAQSEIAQLTFGERNKVLAGLDSVFGEGATNGNKLGVRYLGPAADKRYAGIDTLYDIMQRPSMYDLTPEQGAAISAYGTRNGNMRSLIVEDYGAPLGNFESQSGGVYIPNVDRSQAAQSLDEVLGRSSESALRTGRGKTRVWDSGFDRWANDMVNVQTGNLTREQVFTPETNILALTKGVDVFHANTAANQVFKAGLGGKTKLDVLKETHPDLFNKMTSLRMRLTNLRATAGRLDEKLDSAIETFNTSPMADADVNQLLADLTPRSVRGAAAGMTEAQIRAEVGNIRAQIHDLKPAWEAANPRGYTFVGDGVFRYFKPEEAKGVKTLMQVESSGFFNAIADVNSTVLAGDLSPIIGQQGQLAWMTAPVQTTKAVFGGLFRGARSGDLLRAFKASALAEDVAKSPQSWQDFAFYTGRAAGPGAIPGEFGGGWISRIPKVGEKFAAANDAVYTAVIRAQKNIFDGEVESLVKGGMSRQEANAIAARASMQVVPTPNQSLAGMNKGRAIVPRALVTSVTFMQRPAQVISEATEGLGRIALLQGATPQQKLAIKNLIKMNGTILGLAAGSAAIDAHLNGRDPQEAALAAINPNDKRFMSLVFSDGKRVPLGGPYRAMFKAWAPAPVKTGDGEQVWVPFAGTYNFLKNRISPVVGTQIDLLRNEDFNGNKIMTRDFPFNILQALEYEGESALPLTAGTGVETLRTQGTDAYSSGEALKETGTQLGSQFLGGTVYQPSPLDKFNDIAQKQAGEDFYDLPPAEQNKIREANPDLSKKEIAKGSDERQLAEEVKTEYEGKLQAVWDRFAQDGDTDVLKKSRNEIRNKLYGALSIVYREHPDRQPDPNKPWEVYGKVIADNTDPSTGDVDWDMVDEWRATLTPEQSDAIDTNIGYRAPEAEKQYRAIGSQLRDTGFFELRDQAWAQLKSKYPEALGQYETYYDWYGAEVKDVTRKMIEKGVPKETARDEALNAIASYKTVDAFSKLYRTEFRHRFVVDNKELAKQAVYYGYLDPDAAERKFLRSTD